MSETLEYSTGRASEAEIARHLLLCDNAFVPRLSARVDIGDYACKVAGKAQCFETWAAGELVGLLAVYCNAPDKCNAFITSVSVLPNWQGKGIASQLLGKCIDHVRGLDFERIELEVGEGNSAAIALYKKHGFMLARCENGIKKMTLDLRKGT